jgi:phosphoribosylanthranilate isomerase
MNVKLKVCGMRDPVNIAELVDVRPNYMGFIFYPKSPRYVGNAPEEKIISSIPPHIKKIGVFVNEAIEKVLALGKKFGLQGFQLHGEETAEYCGKLKNEGFIIIKAFAIDENMNFEILQPYKTEVDYFLFDTKTSRHGGSGMVFDWEILRGYDNSRPFFLSGGIDAVHIPEIGKLAGMNLHAVDINSRFELEPGLKDVAKVRDFWLKLRVDITTI